VAGCIPVYLGAPDIADLIPAEAFIDFREFDDYAQLESHLRAMTEEDATRHIQAAREFLASDAAQRFTQARHVELLADLLLGSSDGRG